eukprot:1717197-Lingulodinium_polyedra.AAC.1
MSTPQRAVNDFALRREQLAVRDRQSTSNNEECAVNSGQCATGGARCTVILKNEEQRIMRSIRPPDEGWSTRRDD